MSDQTIARPSAPGIGRRTLLTRAGLAGAAVAVGGGMLGTSSPAEAASLAFGPKGGRFVINDRDILNFALNLEYLEAEFYQRAAFGTGLSAADTSAGGVKGTGTVGTVTGPTAATAFETAAVKAYATEIAVDELNHVRFLRAALGKYAVAEPTIDLVASFTNAAIAAGIITAGQTFNPFTTNPALGLTADASFLLGAFIFEDVGVTAYHGAAPYVKNSAYLSAAAGILAVEAYHAAEVRLQLLQLGQTTPAIITAANAISALRDAASKGADGADPTDQGITLSDGSSNVVPTDANSIAFARSFGSVLNIVYLNTTAEPQSGGFFPAGLNGRITSLVPPVKGKAR